MSQKLRWECLNAWLEQMKKNSKFGKPKKQVIVDDEIELNYKSRKKH